MSPSSRMGCHGKRYGSDTDCSCRQETSIQQWPFVTTRLRLLLLLFVMMIAIRYCRHDVGRAIFWKEEDDDDV